MIKFLYIYYKIYYMFRINFIIVSNLINFNNNVIFYATIELNFVQ